MEKKKYEKA
jgi:hypothetical protein